MCRRPWAARSWWKIPPPISPSDSVIPEAEFLNSLAHRTGCGILCDVNNVHVSAANTGAFDPLAYLDALDASAIGEIHLAGHSSAEVGDRGETLLLDDHGSKVAGAVWALYAHLVRRIGARPRLVEWDRNIPPLADLIAEAMKADMILAFEEADRDARPG